MDSPVWDFSLFWVRGFNKKGSSGRAARVGQEAELEWKVSGVRQTLIQWTVGRKHACPFMVLTVADM